MVLRVRKEKEDEAGLLFPLERRRNAIRGINCSSLALGRARRTSPQLDPCPEIGNGGLIFYRLC